MLSLSASWKGDNRYVYTIFGNYLLANGYVTRDQLFSAMRQEADQHMKLGTLALHAGYMNAAQVDDVVIHQTHQDNRFGELAIQLGYLTEAQVEELLKQQTPAFLSLGQVLLDEGVLTNTDFEQIIQDYRSKNGMEDEESLIERRKNIQQLFENFFHQPTLLFRKKDICLSSFYLTILSVLSVPITHRFPWKKSQRLPLPVV